MSAEIFKSEITYFGKPCILACDAKCNKAFGLMSRPTSPNSLDDDDYEWLADDELEDAPEVTGQTEGGEDKPRYLLEAHNKWCARECERSVMVKPGELIILPNFGERIQNITRS